MSTTDDATDAYRTAWEQDGDLLRGAWEWPGGGYATVMRRRGSARDLIT